MQILVSPEEANDILLTNAQGKTVRVAEHLGSVEHFHRGPQVFRSSFEPNRVIDPHYHLADQFQVFVEGTARIGNHPIDPITVHYADAYSPYGPIVCGERGMAFFNFRARCDLGAEYMPESREGIRIRGGRSITAHCQHLGLGQDTQGFRLQSVIPMHDDGLAVNELVAAPGARLPGAVGGGNGLFHLVLDGQMETEAQTLPRYGIAYVPPGDRGAPRYVGPDGIHLLEVQFPLG